MSDDDSETADPFEQAVALHEAGAFEEAIRHAWSAWCRGDAPQGTMLQG